MFVYETKASNIGNFDIENKNGDYGDDRRS